MSKTPRIFFLDSLAADNLEPIWSRIGIPPQPLADSVELVSRAVYREARLHTHGMQIEQEVNRSQ